MRAEGAGAPDPRPELHAVRKEAALRAVVKLSGNSGVIASLHRLDFSRDIAVLGRIRRIPSLLP